MSSNQPKSQQFWERVDKNGPIPDHCPDLGPCWVWTGAPMTGGYGKFYDGYFGGDLSVHRWSWLVHNGPIPEGLWVLHKCDTPPCVRPDHLFLGTRQDNVKDMVAKGRQSRGWGAEAEDRAYLRSTRQPVKTNDVLIFEAARQYVLSRVNKSRY